MSLGFLYEIHVQDCADLRFFRPCMFKRVKNKSVMDTYHLFFFSQSLTFISEREKKPNVNNFIHLDKKRIL